MRCLPLLLLVLLFLVSCSSSLPAECTIDIDCSPNKCCHADGSVPVDQAPDCEGVICTLECAPNTLDCGGKVVCQSGQCVALFNEV